MPADLQLPATFLVALACALVSVPAAGWLARRLDFQDEPRSDYKLHGRATPYLGGAGVLIAFVAALTITHDSGFAHFGWILGGVGVLWTLGTWDDRRALGPGVRVLIEVALAAILWERGLGWHLFGAESPADLLLTILWIVGLVNAFNLMDNLDGAAGTVALSSLVGIGLTAKLGGATDLAALCAGLAGALLGFLRSNLAKPAKIFLGDGGSMPIGFTVAAAAMALPVQGSASSFLATGLLVGLPILDVALVVVSRKRAKVPVARGGRDHLTHRIQGKVGTPHRVATILAAGQLLLGAGAVVLLELGSDFARIGAAGGVALLGAVAIVVLENDAWAPIRPKLADDDSVEFAPARQRTFVRDRQAHAEAF